MACDEPRRDVTRTTPGDASSMSCSITLTRVARSSAEGMRSGRGEGSLAGASGSAGSSLPAAAEDGLRAGARGSSWPTALGLWICPDADAGPIIEALRRRRSDGLPGTLVEAEPPSLVGLALASCGCSSNTIGTASCLVQSASRFVPADTAAICRSKKRQASVFPAPLSPLTISTFCVLLCRCAVGVTV